MGNGVVELSVFGDYFLVFTFSGRFIDRIRIFSTVKNEKSRCEKTNFYNEKF